MSEMWPSEAPSGVPAWRRLAAGVAEAGALSVVSAQREPSSLPGAAAVGVAAYGRAALP